ncbi:MAG: hypothetical protein EA383_12380 [Spirochaetaceae bacterium]|nr:MAG: hypothetical protein EA383_12380 [Spirochaetaceae bacterium]
MSILYESTYIPGIMIDSPKIVVVGGGFAGVQTVKTLLKALPGAQMTLIDRNEYATMLPALPDVLSGRVRRDAITVRFDEIFDARVRIVADVVSRIDAETRLVHTRNEAYPYDFLVLSNGSAPAFFGFAPESGTLHTVDSFPAAVSLRETLERRLADGQECTLVVVGGGYTGLEVAACTRDGFAAAGRRLKILVVEKADSILAPMAQRVRRRVAKYLERSDIAVATGVSLESLNDDTAVLSDGTRIGNAVVCWSAGMQAATPETSADLPAARDRRLLTNEFLQLQTFPEVFVAGDAAQLLNGDTPVRRAVNFAYYSGRRAGRNIAALVRGRKPKAFSPVDLGWVIPLGGTSSGTIFGFVPVAGKFGLRLHYLMSGFRHFTAGAAFEFYLAAFHLKRGVDVPSVRG